MVVRLQHADILFSSRLGVTMSMEDPSGRGHEPLLRLYVAGDTAGARRALEARLRLIDELGGKVVIEIIDILEQPDAAEKAGILATPVLSDESRSPPRRLVGDISDVAQVLDFFGYRRRENDPWLRQK